MALDQTDLQAAALLLRVASDLNDDQQESPLSLQAMARANERGRIVKMLESLMPALAERHPAKALAHATDWRHEGLKVARSVR